MGVDDDKGEGGGAGLDLFWVGFLLCCFTLLIFADYKVVLEENLIWMVSPSPRPPPPT